MKFAILLAAAAILTGCTHRTLYSWGHYEQMIYASYAAPGKVSPEMQIEQLEADYQKARSKGKRMNPGFHAHLGHLYYQVGKIDQARQEFETEKAQFPESAVFMDRLLANLEPK
jgi:Uncharacterized protein conserved in bacteria